VNSTFSMYDDNSISATVMISATLVNTHTQRERERKGESKGEGGGETETDIQLSTGPTVSSAR